MRIILITLLGLIYLEGDAQNKINSYLYWFDNDLNHSVKTTISPVQNFTLTTQVGTSSLLNGLHLFNIKFFDDSARVSLTSSTFFYKVSPLSGTVNITTYQYWFDGNFAGAVLEPVSAVASFTLASDLSASNLQNGLHVLQMRVKDNNNQWSETVSHFFYKSDLSGTSHNMIAYQYWFDQNFTGAIQQNIASGTAYTLSMPVDALQLLDGLHVYNVRFLDNDHKWSSPISQFIYKTQANENSNISKFQYWFDQNFAGAVQQNVTPSGIYNLSDQLNAITLLDGLHSVSVRLSDNHGKWSSTTTQFFYKEKKDTVSENKMAAYRYWFDEGDSVLNLVSLAPFMNPFITNQNIAADGLDSGQHVIHFQFRDDKGKWSMVTDDSTNVIAKAVYTFNGNGNWSNAANWVNKIKPPLNLIGTYKIFIDPVRGGQCVLDVNQHVTSGTVITVRSGKSFIIPQNLNITQ